MLLNSDLASLEGMPKLQERARDIHEYRRNPTRCKNTPGSHPEAPLGCIPDDPKGKTAPLRWDNRDQDFCDPCRRKLDKPAIFPEMRVYDTGMKYGKEHRESLSQSQRKRFEKMGYVRAWGLMAAQNASGFTYKETALRANAKLTKKQIQNKEGYSLTGIRDWCIDTRMPEYKLDILADVLGTTKEKLLEG